MILYIIHRLPLWSIRLGLAILGGIIFLPFLGDVHLFDWDEINFAESAREMIITQNYSLVQINFQAFWEKPPLFIWMQALSMQAFGINAFAARFPNAICGIASMLVLFEIGRRCKGNIFGIIWTLCYTCAALPFIYFKSGIIDPWFNLFIFLALYFFYLALHGGNKKIKFLHILIAALLIGIATLTKGPVAYLLMGITVTVYLLSTKLTHKISCTQWILFFAVALLTGGSYHIYHFLMGNEKMITDFFTYQMRLVRTEDAGHGGFFLYHVVVLLVGVFPASVFSLKILFSKKYYSLFPFSKMAVILFWITLIIFTFVKTKILHYSSLCYFPLTFLAAIFIFQVYEKKAVIHKWMYLMWYGIAIFYLLAPIVIQGILTHFDFVESMQLIKDDFALACLQTPVVWSGFEWSVSLVLVVTLVACLGIQSPIRKVLCFWVGFLAFLILFIAVYIPKIEAYSQKPAIAFMKRFAGQDVYISTIGYKSYAQYFYAARKEFAFQTEKGEADFLLTEDIDKSVYFVAKKNMLNDILKAYPQLEYEETAGGFVLLSRKIIYKNAK